MKKSNCLKLGIMGGSFDPIHIGHLSMAQEALEYYELDKVIFIPTGKSPHKDRKMTPPIKRLKWVKMAISGNRDFDFSGYESYKETPSYTIETVEYLQSIYKNTELYYIVGEDSLMEIESWYSYEELLKKCVFLAARRSPEWKTGLNDKIVELNKRGFDVREIPFRFLDISSTDIREKFRTGKSPRYYLKKEVYIDIFWENVYADE